MTERERLYNAMKRINIICDGLRGDICQRIETRIGLDKLDELFTRAELAHNLYMRVYARFEAASPEFIREMWNR